MQEHSCSSEQLAQFICVIMVNACTNARKKHASYEYFFLRSLALEIQYLDTIWNFKSYEFNAGGDQLLLEVSLSTG